MRELRTLSEGVLAATITYYSVTVSCAFVAGVTTIALATLSALACAVVLRPRPFIAIGGVSGAAGGAAIAGAIGVRGVWVIGGIVSGALGSMCGVALAGAFASLFGRVVHLTICRFSVEKYG